MIRESAKHEVCKKEKETQQFFFMQVQLNLVGSAFYFDVCGVIVCDRKEEEFGVFVVEKFVMHPMQA